MSLSVQNPPFYEELKYRFKLFFFIGIGMFLFILFFQPLEVNFSDFNSKILFITGLGTITFILLVLLLILVPRLLPGIFRVEKRGFDPDVIKYLFVWIFNSVAFVFYFYYVGDVPMTIYKVFIIAVLCSFPVMVLKITDDYHTFQDQIQSLMEKNANLKMLLLDPDKKVNDTETFVSDNKSEKISIVLNDLILIKSADNYVDFIYREDQAIRRKLIRNTLKNIEYQLDDNPDFIRCHRTCMVNKRHIEKLIKTPTGHRLKIVDYNEEIPVSRQYLLFVREALKP